MPEHFIRLRAAWIGEFADGSTRVDLPTVWSVQPSRPFSLRRSFQIPAIDRGETISLVLDHVPGLTSIRLDGRILAEFGQGVETVSILLDSEISRRVTLTLEVDPGRWGDRAFGEGSLWGSVCLLIRPS